MKKIKLGTKLLLGGGLIVLIPILILGGISAVQSSRTLSTTAYEKTEQVAKNLSGMVQMVLQEELKTMSGISTDPALAAALTEGKTEAASERLTSIKKALGNDYESAILIDANGIIQADGGGGAAKGINVCERDYFIGARGGKASVGTLIKSKQTGNPVSVICAPVYGPNGQLVGAVGVSLKLNFLVDKLTGIRLGQTGYAWMIDKRGIVIAHPKKELVLEQNMSAVEGMKDISARMIGQQSGAQENYVQGNNVITGFSPVELTGWSVAVTQNVDEVMAPARTLRNYIAVIGLLLLGLTLVAVIFFSRSISMPIKQAVQELNEAADQVASASHQVSSASQSLAEGASEQASAIEETSSSMEEMSSMTRQNADNANHANGLMAEAKKVVEKVDREMNKMTGAIAEITKSSEETGKIIKTIDEIAFQTNLLALNAAVEAARAGEAGAGFAVVADEVRNLAMRAAEAARNTSGLIENTIRSVRQGNELTVSTQEAFRENMNNAGKVAELIGEISAASSDQAQGIGQVSKAVAEMDKVVQQNAANAEESASAAEEMNAQAQNMKSITETLSLLVGGSVNGNPSGRVMLGLKRGTNGKNDRTLAIPVQTAPDPQNALERRKQISRQPSPVIPLEEGEFKDF